MRQIAAVYQSLPAARRSAAIVLGSNYGEAGAVDHFGRAYGLSAAYGAQNACWYWGPPPPPASAMAAVAVGVVRQTVTRVCGTRRLAARLNNHLGVHDDEQGAPVWVCSAPARRLRRRSSRACCCTGQEVFHPRSAGTVAVAADGGRPVSGGLAG